MAVPESWSVEMNKAICANHGMNGDQEGPSLFKAQPSLARYPDRYKE